jgi:hypothetical protein
MVAMPFRTLKWSVIQMCVILLHLQTNKETDTQKAFNIVKCRKCVRDLLDGCGLDDCIYWHLIHSTRNYRQLQSYRYSTHFTRHCYIHLHSPLVVPWQRIHDSLTVTSNHIRSLLFTAGLSTLNWTLSTPPLSANWELRNSQSNSLL